jgi:hypothetical protein
VYALILVVLDSKTLDEIKRMEILQNPNRLLVESLLENSSEFMQNIYQYQQSQNKNALLSFRVIKA